MSSLKVDFRGRHRRVSKADAARQSATLRAILERLRAQPGVILSDEVGMGKTFVALGAIASYLTRYPGSRVLVLTPSADLAEKWTQDLERFRRENLPAAAARKMTSDSGLLECSLEDLLGSRKKSRVWILPLSTFMDARSAGGRQKLREITYHLIAKAARLDRDERKEFWRRLMGRRSRLPRLRKRVEWLDVRLPSLKKTVRSILREMELWPFDPNEVSGWELRWLREQVQWTLIRRRLRRFGLIVVDEAHHLRNPDAKRYRAIEGVFRGSYRDMLFLTATPFQLGPGELENVLKLFRLSSERGARNVEARAQEITRVAQEYQDLVRAFEEAWRRLERGDKGLISRGKRCKSPGAGEFEGAYSALKAGHRRLQEALSPWVIRNVKDRPYRSTLENPIPIREEERLPFAILHRLIREYERKSRTFSAVQNLSLTSSWESFRKSAVMRRRVPGAPPVRFYRKALKRLLGRRAERAHPKLVEVTRSVRDAFRQGEKTLIFASRVETVRALHLRLREALEAEVYAPLARLPRKEVDRRLRALRKRAIAARDPLWLRFRENYFRTLLSERDYRRLKAEDIYPDVVRWLYRFRKAYRLVRQRKLDWRGLCYLCESIAFQRFDAKGPVAEFLRSHYPWELDWRRHFYGKLSTDRESRILRRHGCDKRELLRAISQVLSRESVWDDVARTLDPLGETTLSRDELLREELLDALGAILFVPEVMGRAASALNRRHGAAERAVFEAATAPGIRGRVKAFLHEMSRLPAEEVRKYARGLRTGGLVARASGEVSVRDRQRYRYGFNTPFRPYVLVASDVMQEGIDLHRECSHVIHYDLAWNPARLEQRVGRLDRLGSKVDRALAAGREATLSIARRYIPGTIDERMFLRVRDRERWFKFILGHRPDWERDGEDGAGDPPLPSEFGEALRIRLGF